MLASQAPSPILFCLLVYRSLVSFRLFVARVLVALSTVCLTVTSLGKNGKPSLLFPSLPCNNLGTEFKLAPHGRLLRIRRDSVSKLIDDVDTARYWWSKPGPVLAKGPARPVPCPAASQQPTLPARPKRSSPPFGWPSRVAFLRLLCTELMSTAPSADSRRVSRPRHF